MNPTVTDWMQAWSAVLTGFLGVIGAIIALVQLWQIKQQLKGYSLTNVLTLESDMNSRKEKIDDIARQIRFFDDEGKLVGAAKEIYNDYIQTAIENYLNSLDRLCFCILRGYFKEGDWRPEYRDYVADAIQAYPNKFGPSSIYTNIIDLHNKWKRA